MGERPPLFLGLLADHPELVAEVGVLRWHEWGGSPTPGLWIEITAREAGSDRLPITLVAMDLDGRALAAVALGEYDDALDRAVDGGIDGALDGDQRADRGPWLLGMVVRPPERKCGVGRLMVTAIEDLARSRGHERVWVATGSDAVEFYVRCGWERHHELVLGGDELPTQILARELATT